MKSKLLKNNPNTEELLNKEFSAPNYFTTGWDGAYERLLEDIEKLPECQRHLDIGCAQGYFTQQYLIKYPKTEGFGCDLSEVAVSVAKMNCSKGNFIQGTCYDLPYESEAFNLTHMAEVLEHLEFPEKAILEMARVTKSYGYMAITTVNQHAADEVDHLWRWDSAGVIEIIQDAMGEEIKSITEHTPFHNGHITYLLIQKI